jgi:hypothetical protein
MKPLIAQSLLCATLLGSIPAIAAPEFAITGYGTLGYARSDEDFRYLRYIDRDGTLKADSLLGLQLEARFDPKWSATVQVVASAPRTRDSGYEAAIRWAFVGFRPENDWLLRFGRLRPPVLINTQNAEVGVTYDQARLPAEVYTLSPVYDVDGAAFTKTWTTGGAEIALDGYWGTTKINYRLPFQRFVDQQYFPEKIDLAGLVLSRSSETLLLRAGIHRATLKARGDVPFSQAIEPVSIPAPPPFGGDLFVRSGLADRIHVTVLTFGADWRLQDWRITGEYGQRIVNDVNYGVDSRSAYLTAARSVGKWTPYVTYARLLSGNEVRALYRTLNGTPVPLAALGPPLFLPASYHSILADHVIAYDQHSTMLGASYTFSATSKVKIEWMRTRVGLVSALVDGDVHDKSFNVYSVSYSFAF